MQHFDIAQFLTAALAEDIGPGDITGNATIPATMQATLTMRAREPMVAAGLVHLPLLFSLVDPAVKVTLLAADGEPVTKDASLARLAGPARALLAGERTALNLLQHLSGIATLTQHYVHAVAWTGANILDTRKTVPGLRSLQKYAVRCGGGQNHRMGLYDAVLIKDNHLAIAGGVRQAVEAARAAIPSGTTVEVECDTLAQLDEALAAKTDSVLLDNMDLVTLREAVLRAKAHGVITEASGNVTLETVRAIALTGVDRISIGRLTHSVRAVDIGLDAV